MIHYRKRTWMILLGLFVAVFTFTFLTGKIKDNKAAQAANALAFNPGYIISDWQMTNYNSMSEAEIQDFLTSKNPCGNQDRGQYDRLTQSYSDRSWHWEGNHFVCLSQERFDGVNIGSGETAAHIIWQAAQDYRINPQALIVLLEKESSLITDPIPNTKDYKTATGFACPDTGPCDSARMGLKNQIRLAAELYREVMDGGWTNYPVGNNYIQYNPNKACGGTIVNIQNRATSALYRYTPYQPNASALAAGYGAGDGCGAYGNRNFYLLFEDWFGGITQEELIVEAKTSFVQSLRDGTYQIVSKAQPDKAIDVKGGVYPGLTTGFLQAYPRKLDGDASNQVFEIKYDANDGYYNITNPTTGSVFDVKGGFTVNKTHTQIYPFHDSCNQDWLLNEVESGYYNIISRCSSKALDLSESTNFVNIFTSHGSDNQQWRFERVDDEPESKKLDGTYQIVSKAQPDKAIDVKGGVYPGLTTGFLQAYPRKLDGDASNQVFEIKYDDSLGYYSIINPTTGSAVDIKGGLSNDKTPTQIFPLHNRCNQAWSFERDADGYYSIISVCSGKVLDLSQSTNFVNIFTSHGGDNQKWKLEKISS